MVLYENRFCSGNVTLSRKQIPAGHLGGRGLRPDPLDSLADPLDGFENIYAGHAPLFCQLNVLHIVYMRSIYIPYTVFARMSYMSGINYVF